MTTQAWGHVYCIVQRTLQLLVTQTYKRWVIIIITKLGISVTGLIVVPMKGSKFWCSLHLPSDTRWKGMWSVLYTFFLTKSKYSLLHEYHYK